MDAKVFRRVKGFSVLAVVVMVLALALVGSAPAHVTQKFGHLFNKHIKPELAGEGTINATGNPVDWTKLKGVPANIADGDDAVGPAGPQGPSGPAGPAGPAGATHVVGYAFINASGDVGNSFGIADANIVKSPNTTGFYCIVGLDFKVLMATPFGTAQASGGAGTSSACPDPIDETGHVALSNSSGVNTDGIFQIVLFGD